jgi:hypothetical protein
MPLQTARDYHVDSVLSNILVNRRPEGYIADRLVPIMPVSKQSDIYMVRRFKESIMWTPGLTDMAPGTKAREVFFTVSSDTYFAKKYGLGTYWVTEDEVNADEAISMDRDSAELVTDRLLIDYEMRIAGLAAGSNIATLTHVATAWDNTTGSRPFDDLSNEIERFRLRTGLRPNRLVIPEQVMTFVRRNDHIRDILFGDRGGVATDQQIANLLNIEQILVPAVMVNTAGPIETFNGSGFMASAWPNKVLLAKVSAFPGRQIDTWVQAFRWTNPKLGTPWAIRRHTYDTKRMRQDIDAIYYQGEKVVSPDLCTAIDSVIA